MCLFAKWGIGFFEPLKQSIVGETEIHGKPKLNGEEHVPWYSYEQSKLNRTE